MTDVINKNTKEILEAFQEAMQWNWLPEENADIPQDIKDKCLRGINLCKAEMFLNGDEDYILEIDPEIHAQFKNNQEKINKEEAKKNPTWKEYWMDMFIYGSLFWGLMFPVGYCLSLFNSQYVDSAMDNWWIIPLGMGFMTFPIMGHAIGARDRDPKRFDNNS